MAGYSKGIVDTRKLNKDSKAKLGRRGTDGVKDTEIREVDNRASHVNALEAYLIDVNGKAGEEYAKRVGAGTVNPLTGMPEYHKGGALDFIGHPMHHDWYWTGKGDPSKSPEAQQKKQEDRQYQQIERQYGSGQLSYDELAGMDPKKFETYLKGKFDIGEDSMEYIRGFEQKPFGLLGEQQALTIGRAGETRGFTEKGLESAYGTTMGALGSQQETLGRTTGLGLREAGKGRDIAASRSGLATSGTITQAYETQKKDLFQDYAAGTKDIGRQKGTALETLTLGKEEAAATEGYIIAGADLDFRRAEYAEQQRQLDELYADVAAIPS